MTPVADSARTRGVPRRGALPVRSARWRWRTGSVPNLASRALPPQGTPGRAARCRCAEKCTAGKARRQGALVSTARSRSALRTARSRRNWRAGWTPAAPWALQPSFAGSQRGGRCGGIGGGGAATQLAFDVIERGVAYVLAVDHVDDVLADVLGVVPDALESPYHPHHIECPADGARILHHEGDALTLDGLVLLVHQAILAGDTQCRLDVHARERVERCVHHVRDHAAEMLDLAVLVGRAFHGGEARSKVTDLLAFIADALEVG